MDVSQSAAYIHSLTYENGFLSYAMDIPKSNSPLWLLGVNYSALYDLEDIKLDVTSRLWFTYRRGFTPIDVKAGNYLKRRLRLKKQALNCLSCYHNPHGKGPISDNGWGCMLRCGQMMLGQALLNRHIGRDWRWSNKKHEPKYERILRSFLDRKESCYSIHQIACMGVSEGKKIGSWFGPNTVAQVLRKLCVYDTWSNIVVHVAMDNTVITSDIRRECRCICRNGKKGTVNSEHGNTSSGGSSSRGSKGSRGEASESDSRGSGGIRKRHPHSTPTSSSSRTPLDPSASAPSSDPSNSRSHRSPVSFTCSTPPHSPSPSPSPSPSSSPSSESGPTPSTSQCRCVEGWRPLLLMIPLRLGLSEVNEVYYEALKFCLSMPQSVGIIGGKPNHAYWFIGHIDNNLLYLDPHMTQSVVEGGGDDDDHSDVENLAANDYVELGQSSRGGAGGGHATRTAGLLGGCIGRGGNRSHTTGRKGNNVASSGGGGGGGPSGASVEATTSGGGGAGSGGAGGSGYGGVAGIGGGLASGVTSTLQSFASFANATFPSASSFTTASAPPTASPPAPTPPSSSSSATTTLPSSASSASLGCQSDDTTYHCNHVSRMTIADMDPSMAVGFYCHSEAQFEDWQRCTNRRYEETRSAAMFEVLVDRPKHWPTIHSNQQDNSTAEPNKTSESPDEDRQYDEEFELI